MNRFDDGDKDHGADDCHDNGAKGTARINAQKAEQKTADNCADNAENNINQYAVPAPTDKDTRKPSRDKSDKKKPNNIHKKFFDYEFFSTFVFLNYYNMNPLMG